MCVLHGHSDCLSPLYNVGFTTYTETGMASSLFGEGDNEVFVSDLGCTGSERNLLECPHLVDAGRYCSPVRNVGLRCEGKKF